MGAVGQRRTPVVHQENLMFLWKFGQTDKNVRRMKQTVHSRNMKFHFHCFGCHHIFLCVAEQGRQKIAMVWKLMCVVMDSNWRQLARVL
jgi:hypothetical protein